MADKPIAKACELMCQPSASSAIELKAQPAKISTTIVTKVIHMTQRVLRSAASELLSKAWSWAQSLRSSLRISGMVRGCCVGLLVGVVA